MQQERSVCSRKYSGWARNAMPVDGNAVFEEMQCHTTFPSQALHISLCLPRALPHFLLQILYFLNHSPAKDAFSRANTAVLVQRLNFLTTVPWATTHFLVQAPDPWSSHHKLYALWNTGFPVPNTEIARQPQCFSPCPQHCLASCKHCISLAKHCIL